MGRSKAWPRAATLVLGVGSIDLVGASHVPAGLANERHFCTLLPAGNGIFAAMRKRLFLWAGLLVMAYGPAQAQTSGPDIVVVKVAEYQNNTQLVIAHGEGKSEVLEFEGGGGPNAITQSAKRVQQVLAKLYAQGYVLKSTFSGDHGSMSTLIFLKGQ